MSGAAQPPPYPFDAQRAIGTISQIGPASARANLPRAGKPTGKLHHGHRIGGGEVGEFVVVECDEVAIFGRVIEVRLPERERLSVEAELGKERNVHPVGTIQFLASIDLASGAVLPGVSRHPRLGNQVYAAHPDLARWLIEHSWRMKHEEAGVTLNMATLPDMEDATVGMTAEQLFGRHCAVLGATGGGKSWTVARLIEEALKFKSKVILLDATGEFHSLKAPSVKHVHIGCTTDTDEGSTETAFPYTMLTESDLFAILKPSGQTQGPKLRAAMKSLKLVRIEAALATEGLLVKANMPKKPVEDAYRKHVAVVEGLAADFDITLLSRQIEQECAYPSASYGKDASKWGDINGNEYGWCVPLIYRIDDVVRAKEVACIFDPGESVPLPHLMLDFVNDNDQRVLRVSLQHLPFANNAREIVANAIGRSLLDFAREGRFREEPLVVILDEAHQFLNKSLGDEHTRVYLDAFGLIAKEGRKYSLNICIATQRPRDIPEDVLSQIGTLIVHRLTNEQDRKVVENASGEIDRSASSFLPTLGPGEALIVGVDFPVPLSVRIDRPGHEPQSKGADYQRHWRKADQTGPEGVAGQRDAGSETARAAEVVE